MGRLVDAAVFVGTKRGIGMESAAPTLRRAELFVPFLAEIAVMNVPVSHHLEVPPAIRTGLSESGAAIKALNALVEPQHYTSRDL